MTPTELKGAVLFTAGDPGMERYTLALLVNRISMAQNMLARELRPIELLTYGSRTWAVTIDEYLIAGDSTTGFEITDFIKEYRITWDGYKLQQKTIDDLDEHSTGSSNPGFYYLRGGYIGLGPLAPASEKTVRIYYIKRPTAFTTTTLPTAIDFPDEYHRALELLSAFLLTNDTKLYGLYQMELDNLRWHSAASSDSIIIEPPIE